MYIYIHLCMYVHASLLLSAVVGGCKGIGSYFPTVGKRVEVHGAERMIRQQLF